MFSRVLGSIKSLFGKAKAVAPAPSGAVKTPAREPKKAISFEVPNSGRLNILDDPRFDTREKVEEEVKRRLTEDYNTWKDIYKKNEYISFIDKKFIII